MSERNSILERIQGSMVALVTPMNNDNSIDWKALDELVEWHITEGTQVIVAVGTTGESATLDVDEHTKVIKAVIDKVANRIPVIAGTGANSTSEAIELTKKAKELGADAALLVAPYYNKPTQEGLYQHYKAIAEAVDIPQMLYNVPGRTVVDIANETTLRLAELDNIFAIKDATGDVERGAKLIKDLNGKIDVFSGDDPTALQLVKQGAKGNISVTANVAPKAMSEIFSAALSGDFETANKINTDIEELHKVLFVESNPIPAKYALYKMNKIQKGMRLPLTWLSESQHDIVDTALLNTSLIQAS